MNREIKFRAWHKLNEIMIYEGWSKTVTGYDSWHDKATIFGYGESAEIMQFTGLKDKNNTPIYEGDVLDFGYPMTDMYGDTYHSPLKVVIDYHGGAFWFTGGGYTDCNWHFYNSEDREVIGNIYEHPHLLK